MHVRDVDFFKADFKCRSDSQAPERATLVCRSQYQVDAILQTLPKLSLGMHASTGPSLSAQLAPPLARLIAPVASVPLLPRAWLKNSTYLSVERQMAGSHYLAIAAPSRSSSFKPGPVTSVPDRLAPQHLRSPLQPDAVADEVVLENAIVPEIVVCEVFEQLGRVWKTIGE